MHRQQIKNYLQSQFSLPEDQIEIMVPGFIRTLAEHMDNMETVLESGDLDMLGKSAHTIKGALLNLGLHDLAEMAMTIEQRGKADDHTLDYRSLVASLRARIDNYIT